jgi:transposase
MTLAPSRIGIDVSKHWLDIHDATLKKSWRIANTPAAIAHLIGELPPASTLLFEATAPYDGALRCLASEAGHVVLRVNPSRARNFARSEGYLAKTDAIDARMLAAMAEKTTAKPERAFDAAREALTALNRRRDQLVETRAVERGRRSEAQDEAELTSLTRHIAWLDVEIKAIERQIANLIAASPTLVAQARLLRSLPGVGAVTLATLLALLPELGRVSGKTIAALVGLAPINQDSGAFRGQRHIGGGRRRVRRALYMAALSAVRKVPRLKAQYEAIKQRSGHAKIALVAIARKLLVILNAMAHSGEPFRA